MILYKSFCGSIAQLGEHLPYKQRVIGSSPIVPTIYFVSVYGRAFFMQFYKLCEIICKISGKPIFMLFDSVKVKVAVREK